MSSRSIFVTGLVFVFAILTNLILNQIEDDAVTKSVVKNDPDLYMLNATVTQLDSTGQVHHKIIAERFTHFPLTDVTALISPQIKMYPSPPGAPWDISSKNGRLLSQSVYREEVVELWDDVLAIQLKERGEFLNIQSQSLTVHTNKDFIETNDKVFVDDNGGRTTAAAMKAWLDTGKFEFYSSNTERVRSVLLPNFESSNDETN